MATVRAVQMGYTAPRHQRTEPYTFKRLLSHDSIERLANIAANVYYYQQMNKLRQQQQHLTNAHPNHTIEQRQQQDERKVQKIIKNMERKRDNWRNIPAFLVTLLVPSKTDVTPDVTTMTHHPDDADEDDDTPRNITTMPLVDDRHKTNSKEQDDMNITEDEYWYRPLPFRPIVSELEGANYAAACAATQNLLLSLHAEQMATKWVTGPILHTPAFYELLQLPGWYNDDESHQHPNRTTAVSWPSPPEPDSLVPTETTAATEQEAHRVRRPPQQPRVVALVMIGQAAAAVVDNDNDDDIQPDHHFGASAPEPPSGMDYFHQLHQQQQRRRIPKRRTFQDLLHDV